MWDVGVGGLVLWTSRPVVESGLVVLEVGWLWNEGVCWEGRMGGSTTEVRSEPDELQLT